MSEHPEFRKDYKKAVRHLKKNDPVLKAIIEKIGECNIELERDIFHTLAKSIIYQQISITAAGAIFSRLMLLNSSYLLTPEFIIDIPVSRMRNAGVSNPKSRYLKDLAEKFLDGTITPERFEKMGNEEIIEQLIKVKGIGRWTAETFLIFSLGRMDILPLSDTGLQRAIKTNYKLRNKITPEKIKKIARKWSPYDALAAWYLWKSLSPEKFE